MAHAPSLTRSDRAVGIVTRQEVLPSETQDGYFYVTDSGTGSGKTYLASATSCTCPDHQFRGNRCKHQIAAAKEEEALRQFAAHWDTRAAEARAALDDLPGNFLDTNLSAFDDIALTAPRGAVYRGQYFTAEQCDAAEQARKAAGPRCPDCGAELESRTYWVGGRGYSCFLVCTRDIMHRSLRA